MLERKLNCQKCGEEIKPNWKHCPKCGTEVFDPFVLEEVESMIIYKATTDGGDHYTKLLGYYTGNLDDIKAYLEPHEYYNLDISTIEVLQVIRR